MPPRYIVRRTADERRYSVWDNDNDQVAVSDYRECIDLIPLLHQSELTI